SIVLQGARNQRSWITIAPDWEGVPDGSRFRLTVAGTDRVLATTRWARLLPAQILDAAGLPLVSPSSRTVNVVYEAHGRGGPIQTNVALTFGPADPTVAGALAPHVPAVVGGATIPVSYDISNTANVSSPTLLVSE